MADWFPTPNKVMMTTLIEYWRWRYKDPVAGQSCKTTALMTAHEAAPYPYARRIPGTLAYRDARSLRAWRNDGEGVDSDDLPTARPQ